MKRQFCHVISSLHATLGHKLLRETCRWDETEAKEQSEGHRTRAAVAHGISHMETVVVPFISLHWALKLIINNAVSPVDAASNCCCNGMLLQPKRNYCSNNNKKVKVNYWERPTQSVFPLCLLVISECPMTYFLLEVSRGMSICLPRPSDVPRPKEIDQIKKICSHTRYLTFVGLVHVGKSREIPHY